MNDDSESECFIFTDFNLLFLDAYLSQIYDINPLLGILLSVAFSINSFFYVD